MTGTQPIVMVKSARMPFLGIFHTWWLIPLSKWVITPVINGISRVNPLITGVITHLLSGMSHQVGPAWCTLMTPPMYRRCSWKTWAPRRVCRFHGAKVGRCLTVLVAIVRPIWVPTHGHDLAILMIFHDFP